MIDNKPQFFKFCEDYKDELIAIFQANVFETKGNKIVLHFHPTGGLMKIIKGEEELWKKKALDKKV